MKRFQIALSYIAVGLIGLVIGFFSGREYLKYEIQATVQSVVDDLRKDFAGTIAGSTTATTPATSKIAAAKAPPPPKPKEVAPVVVTLVSKGFKPHDLDRGDYEDDITFVLSIKNTGERAIRALDGTLHLTDLLDNEIMPLSLAINEPIAAGGKITWSGAIKYNQFLDQHERLRAARLENMKTRFEPRKLLFADGSTKQYETQWGFGGRRDDKATIMQARNQPGSKRLHCSALPPAVVAQERVRKGEDCSFRGVGGVRQAPASGHAGELRCS